MSLKLSWRHFSWGHTHIHYVRADTEPPHIYDDPLTCLVSVYYLMIQCLSCVTNVLVYTFLDLKNDISDAMFPGQTYLQYFLKHIFHWKRMYTLVYMTLKQKKSKGPLYFIAFLVYWIDNPILCYFPLMKVYLALVFKMPKSLKCFDFGTVNRCL